MTGPGVAADGATAAAHRAAEQAGRECAGRVLAATLRSVGDLDIAEESTADAFLLALQTWPRTGVPASVEAWLITAARHRAVDRIRRAQAGRRALLRHTGRWTDVVAGPADVAEAALVGDDELRMVVLCCDPRLSTDDQVALTLRLVCGVPTEAVAAGFGVATATMAARLTRAKAKLVRSGPRLDLPDDRTVDERLPATAMVVYLAFTLGHTAGSGVGLTDDALQDRAQYLATVLHRLRPDHGELTALLALIQLTRSRAAGRLTADGTQVLLADADRTTWDGALRATGIALAATALASTDAGPLARQAAIAAVHARAASWAVTDWDAIIGHYDALLRLTPSHTAAVGRCVAVGERYGAAAGLADLDEVLDLGGLDRYPYAAAARAHLVERAGGNASADWGRAAALARTDAERAHFTARASRPTGPSVTPP